MGFSRKFGPAKISRYTVPVMFKLTEQDEANIYHDAWVHQRSHIDASQSR